MRAPRWFAYHAGHESFQLRNIDEIAKRAMNAGITLKSDPQDTQGKSRAFEVSDPSRFLLTIFSETSA